MLNDTNPPPNTDIDNLVPEANPGTLYKLNRVRSNDRAITDEHLDLTSKLYELDSFPLMDIPLPAQELVSDKTPEVAPTPTDEGKSTPMVPPVLDTPVKAPTSIPTKPGMNPLAAVSPELAKTATNLDSLMAQGQMQLPTPSSAIPDSLDPTFGDYLKFFVSPFTAAGAAVLAPIAKNNYSGSTLNQIGQAFGTATEAFWGRLNPELTITTPENSKTLGDSVVEKYLNVESPTQRKLLGSLVDILGDPSIVMGTWATMVAQKGVQAVLSTGKPVQFTKMQSTPEDGPFYKGLQSFLGMGEVDLANSRLTDLGRLAKQADLGDRVAIEKLDQLFSKDKELQALLGEVISPEEMDGLIRATDEAMLVTTARTPGVKKVLEGALGTPKDAAARNFLKNAESSTRNGVAVSDSQVASEILDASVSQTDVATRPILINLKHINNEVDFQNSAQYLESRFIEDFQIAARRSREGGGLPDWEFSAKAQNEKLWDMLGTKTTQYAPEQAYAIRQSMVASADMLQRLARKVVVEQKSPNGLQAGTSLAWGKMFALNKAIYQKAVGVQAEAGRALRSYQMKAETTPDKYNEIGDVLQRLVKSDPDNVEGAVPVARQIVAELVAAPGMTTPDKVARFLSRANEQGLIGMQKMNQQTFDSLYEIYVNSILSGPITHSKNIASNGYTLLRRPTISGLSGVNAAVRGDVLEAMVKFHEARVELAGMVEGMNDVFRTSRVHGVNTSFQDNAEMIAAHEIAGQVHKPSISSEAYELDPTSTLGRAVDAVGDFIRLPGTFLLKEDVAFKSIHYRMSVNQQAARKALEGTGTGKWDADTQSLFNYFRNNPDRDSIKTAVKDAEVGTFTNALDGPISNRLYLFAKGVPGARWFVPFIRTPINIIKAGIKHSPLGMFKDVYTVVKKGGPEADEAMANLAVGSAFVGSVWSMLGNNDKGQPRITGSINTRTPLGKMMASNKIPAYSLRVGDEWISYEGIEPLRTMLGMIVHSGEALANIDLEWDDGIDNMEKVHAAATSAFFGVPFENFMLPQISQLHYMVEELQNADKVNTGALKVHRSAIVNQLSRFGQAMTTPQFLRQWSNVEARGQFFEATSYLETVRASIAGLGGDEYFGVRTPQQYDMFGDPRFSWPGGVGPDLATPFPVMKAEEPDEITREVIRLQLPVSHPARDAVVPGVGARLKMNAHQRSEYTRMAGQGVPGEASLKESMLELVEEPSYGTLHDDYKREMLLGLVSDYRRAAMLHLIATDVDLQNQASQAEKIEAERLGVNP